MPTALSDPSLTMYILLGGIVAVLGLVAYRRQKKADVVTFAVGLLVFLAVMIIDRTVESPREQVARKIAEMGTASRNRKYEDLFKHVSESFQHKFQDRVTDKAKLRQGAKFAEGVPDFRGINETSVDRSWFKQVDDNTVEQEFLATHAGSPPISYLVKATFKKEADGEWRLASFRLFDGLKQSEEKPLPGI